MNRMRRNTEKDRENAKIVNGGSPLFFLHEGLSNIRLNGFMSFAAISIIGICILIMGSISLVALNANKMVVDVRESSQIRVFIDLEFPKERYNEIEENILGVIDVREVEYLSREESFEVFGQRLGEQSSMLDGLEQDNPLRDGYIVYLSALEHAQMVSDTLAVIEGIANVESDNAIYETLVNLETGVRVISIILVSALGAVSIFIIANTVKLAMFSRKGEIAIMKMIGATNMFIRWPFIVEGLVLGVCGSLLAFFGQWVIYEQSSEIINTFIGFVDIVDFNSIIGLVLPCFLIVGAIVGVLGSLFTIRKFLDV